MDKTLCGQPELPADQFLYERRGPWPQPSPSYPLANAPEILNVPPVETMIWTQAIGSRYFQTEIGFPGAAAANAVVGGQLEIPSDAEFVRMMTNSVFARSLRPVAGSNTWISNFHAMELMEGDTVPGTFVRRVSCVFERNAGQFSCTRIDVANPTGRPLEVSPSDPAWNLAKAYALQGASYVGMFVVHPALHFPMDTVNAITKTAVPRNHPLFQLLHPHSAYALAVNNAVLETEDGVLSSNPQGTWFDPLTATGLVIKRLFGAGYAGLPNPPGLYPQYDYMNPWMDGSLPYGHCLRLYFDAFLGFCETVEKEILGACPNDIYVERWANYISAQLHGFPDGKAIFQPGVLTRALAVYMWDVTVSHAADHYSYTHDVTPAKPPTPPVVGTTLAAWKFLRLRVPPPQHLSDGAAVKLVGDVCPPDDLYRAEMTQELFLKPATIYPNLVQTTYAFTSLPLLQAQEKFHADLRLVAAKVAAVMPNFMPLEVSDTMKDYSRTISASVQY
ncbi:hypothetical protein [Hydrogenophaga sp.]|uniref:hypothetical protein n=1 Tax=Hydrogenophaga sp. TaxID=1904254 RepID=UPI0025B88F06|nr:hypothetical protein [Hydrogenophaga sp.]MBT9465348.1 hypothetical protein [Hydrogenophaga sp.]